MEVESLRCLKETSRDRSPPQKQQPLRIGWRKASCRDMELGTDQALPNTAPWDARHPTVIGWRERDGRGKGTNAANGRVEQSRSIIILISDQTTRERSRPSFSGRVEARVHSTRRVWRDAPDAPRERLPVTASLQTVCGGASHATCGCKSFIISDWTPGHPPTSIDASR
jgi:hypothetical protein